MQRVAAVSFDFFNTLATHRDGRGRGALVREFLQAHGWTSDPWNHQVLYDVFDVDGSRFTPTMTAAELEAFAARIARTLFRQLRVDVDPAVGEQHALELWRILGPAHFELFPEVQSSLSRLRAAGFGLAVVSNWQRGLKGFCDALGIGAHLDVVIASGEVQYAKPNPAIFVEACRQLALPPARVLHVGDSMEDLDGARHAGLHTLWLRRGTDVSGQRGTIRSLDEAVELLTGLHR